MLFALGNFAGMELISYSAQRDFDIISVSFITLTKKFLQIFMPVVTDTILINYGHREIFDQSGSNLHENITFYSLMIGKIDWNLKKEFWLAENATAGSPDYKRISSGASANESKTIKRSSRKSHALPLWYGASFNRRFSSHRYTRTLLKNKNMILSRNRVRKDRCLISESTQERNTSTLSNEAKWLR